jgi:pimeloyl-ACP methyl ester carboxylesterase
MQGDRDPIYPIELSLEMYRAIPKAALWVVPNGGHVPLSEMNTPIFNDYILNAFDGHGNKV